METPVLIALLVAVVVAFFGWQWWSASGRRRGTGSGSKSKATSVAGMIASAEKPLASLVAPPAQEERYPEVVGQTEADLRAKEPDQRQPHAGASRPQPVTADGKGPAAIEDNLRHPEQAFHQPQVQQQQYLSQATAAGIASHVSTPGFASTGPSTPPMSGHQQPFVPEMAQNGGAIVGDSMFAFDGMAPTSFAEF